MPRRVVDTPNAVSPIGPYSIAVEADAFVFFAGTVALDPEDGTPVQGDAATQARRVMENIGLALSDAGLGFEDVVKATIYLARISDFQAVNEVYSSYFPHDPPARTTVGGLELPGGFLLEIEVIAARPS